MDDFKLKTVNPIYYFLPIYFIFYLGLLSRSRGIRVLLFIPILSIAIYVWFHTTTEMDNNAIWTLIAQTVLMASDAFVMNDVSKLKRVGQKVDTDKLRTWDRTKWAIDFMFNYRQIGWTHEPRHVLPPHPNETKWRFVRSRTAMALRYFVLCDVAQTMTWYLPLDEWRDWTARGVAVRVAYTALSLIVGKTAMALGYTIGAIVFVGTNLSQPCDWPESFGRWSDAYTVRRAWGRTWHQNLRRVISVHGDFITFRILCLKKDTFIGTNVQRYIAFGISGIMHALGDYGMYHSWEKLSTLKFFLYQPTAIMIEQEVGKLFGIKPGKWTRRAGYIWTFCWFALTSPAWLDRMRDVDHASGFWKSRSATNYLLTGKWD